MASAANSDIFSQHGGVVSLPQGTEDTPVYIALMGDAGNNLRMTLAGKAPALAISITNAVDHMLHKSLRGDYLITEFGHKPLDITIAGLDLYAPGCNLSDEDNASTIQDFYSRFNVHANKKARVDVGFSSAGGDGTSSAAYRCVIVRMVKRINPDTTDKAYGIGRYELALIGVQLT